MFTPKCFQCGHELVWQSDYMKSEVGYIDSNNEEDDGVVSCYDCPNCGTHYEVIEPDKEEKDELDYYKS